MYDLEQKQVLVLNYKHNKKTFGFSTTEALMVEVDRIAREIGISKSGVLEISFYRFMESHSAKRVDISPPENDDWDETPPI